MATNSLFISNSSKKQVGSVVCSEDDAPRGKAAGSVSGFLF